jgi:hypothetical protein
VGNPISYRCLLGDKSTEPPHDLHLKIVPSLGTTSTKGGILRSVKPQLGQTTSLVSALGFGGLRAGLARRLPIVLRLRPPI